MAIRWKPLSIIVAAFSALMLSLFFISKAILLDSFVRIEEEDTRKNVQRVLDALSDNLASLSRVTSDYAAWDDSYDFIITSDPKFISANLVDTTFTNLKLNLIAFYDVSGRRVFSKAYDLAALAPTDVPQIFSPRLPRSSPLLRQNSFENGGPGSMVLLPGGPMLIVAKPILRSDKKGPSRGTLIMGRYLDSAEIDRLAHTTHLSLEMKRFEDTRLPDDFRVARHALPQSSGILVRPLSGDSIAGYTVVRDLYGKPGLLVRVVTPRAIYLQGLATIRYFLLWFLSVSLLCGVTAYHLIDKYLSAQKKSMEGEKRYQAVIEQASEGIVLIDEKTGRVTETNRAFQQMLGYSESPHMTLHEILGPGQEEIEHIVSQVSRENGQVSREIRMYRHDGSPVDAVISMNRIVVEGRGLLCGVIHDITERKRTEERLTKLNECFLGFTAEPAENIQRLTALCGELMGAACALYNRLMNGTLHTLAQWQAPPDFNPVDHPDGHICHDVIKRGGKQIFVVQDLPRTPYADTDPNVLRYNLKTYVGIPVRCSGNSVGSLCVVYQRDFEPTEEDKKLMGIVAVAVEAAEESKLASEFLRESERFARSTLEALPEHVAILDEDGFIIAVNQQWRNFARNNVSVLQSPIEGANYFEACNNAVGKEREYAAAFAAGIRSVLLEKRESFSLEYPCDFQGEQLWFLGRANRFSGDGPKRIVLVHENITELKRAELNIQKLAYFDTLTGLPNRLLLQDRLRQAIKRAERNRQMLALLFLDLDHFKVINDTLGHAAGDQLLKEVANRLSRHVRAYDTVARMGGDEFVLLLNQVTATGHVSGIAQNILETLAPPFELGIQEVFVTTSIGIAMYPTDGADGERLLKNADTAMYLAKERGRNAYQYFSAELNLKAEERLVMETNLRHALEKGEFLLFYQPWQDLESGRITGMEALLRWRHPTWGMVPPDSFIQLAEETGLIIPIGKWVLHTACSQLQSLRKAGYPSLRMAVNLSGRQLKNYPLVETLSEILENTGIEPARLELELTEGSMMENVEKSIALLRDVKKLGVGLAIDDFGTGYASLNYLKSFPVDKLKIDRSFVTGIPHDPDDSAITRAIIAIAESLKLQVIAEGVETAEQMDFLREHSCHEIQGYLVSRPLPHNELMDFLAKKCPKTSE
jgi:diguanylate cyclase (GGDEF)-like protein/PAS domain S-box-containing protein